MAGRQVAAGAAGVAGAAGRGERLLVEAGVAVTAAGVRRDVGLLLEGDRIAAVAPVVELRGQAVDRRLGGPRALALPGLVNAHQHGRSRSTVALGIPDQPLECWLAALLALPRVDPYADTLAVARRLLATGVTTTLHMHSSAADRRDDYEAELRAVLAAYRDAGLRAVVAADVRDRGLPVYGTATGIPDDVGADLRARLRAAVPPSLPAGDVLDVVTAVRAAVAAGEYGAGDVALGPAGPPWCSEALYRRVAAFAVAHDVLVSTHLHESQYQREFGRRAYGDGTVAALGRFGLLTPRLVVAHGVWLDAADREALAGTGVSVVTNPGSNLRLHAGVAAVRELLAAGVNVALGTDNMALGDRDELLDELRLLRALQRRPSADDRGVDAPTALAIATRNGGRALRRPDVGVLAPGAAGDVVLADLDRLVLPGSPVDPVEAAVALLASPEVDTVVAGGRVVVEDGRPVDAPPPPATPRFDPEAPALGAAAAAAARTHFSRWDPL